MANTFELIASSTVGATSVTSIDFTSIPSTYTDLVVIISGRTDGSGNMAMQVNSTTSGYTGKRLSGSGTSATSDSLSGQNGFTGNSYYTGTLGGSSSTASTFGNAQFYIPNYAGSTNKSISTDTVNENNGTAAYMDLTAGLLSNTAAISSIKLLCWVTTDKFVQYTTAYLYGVRNS
jgi:hypothetical protein